MTKNIIYTDRMTVEELNSLYEIAKKAISECTSYPKYEYWSDIEFQIIMELKRRTDD